MFPGCRVMSLQLAFLVKPEHIKECLSELTVVQPSLKFLFKCPCDYCAVYGMTLCLPSLLIPDSIPGLLEHQPIVITIIFQRRESSYCPHFKKYIDLSLMILSYRIGLKYTHILKANSYTLPSSEILSYLRCFVCGVKFRQNIIVIFTSQVFLASHAMAAYQRQNRDSGCLPL